MGRHRTIVSLLLSLIVAVVFVPRCESAPFDDSAALSAESGLEDSHQQSERDKKPNNKDKSIEDEFDKELDKLDDFDEPAEKYRAPVKQKNPIDGGGKKHKAKKPQNKAVLHIADHEAHYIIAKSGGTTSKSFKVFRNKVTPAPPPKGKDSGDVEEGFKKKGDKEDNPDGDSGFGGEGSEKKKKKKKKKGKKGKKNKRRKAKNPDKRSAELDSLEADLDTEVHVVKKREAREGYGPVNEAIFVVQKAGGTTHRSFVQMVKPGDSDYHQQPQTRKPSKPKQQLRYTEVSDGTTSLPDGKADDLFAMNLSPLEEKKHGGYGKKAKAGKKKGKGKKKRKSKKKKKNPEEEQPSGDDAGAMNLL